VSRAQRSASLKGVYSVSPRRRASTPLCLRGLWASGALQTPISGLPEIGAQMRAGRVNPTCVDRYTHRLRDGPGPAAHRFAIARAAPHPGHVAPYLSAYGVKPAGDAPENGQALSQANGNRFSSAVRPGRLRLPPPEDRSCRSVRLAAPPRLSGRRWTAATCSSWNQEGRCRR
jgi:hypothetical protein